MMYRGNRFCSERCRDYYDAGNPGDAQDWLRPDIIYYDRDGRPMKMTTQGFLIPCAHCQKEFDSKSLRSFSPECERRYRERQDNLAVDGRGRDRAVRQAPMPRMWHPHSVLA
jgi:endogenous inhibitor of DNA gyrase (YacG/DUF329 family)